MHLSLRRKSGRRRGSTKRRPLRVSGKVPGATALPWVTAVLIVCCGSVIATTARADTANPPQNTSPPRVTGNAAAFQTVSCDPGQWNPAAVTFAYQWLIDDDQVTTATPATQTWTLDTGEVNHPIACRVTATDPATGLTGVATSAFVTVTQGEITNTAPPTITGTPAPGNTVSCAPGQWTPPPDAYSYQWLRDGLTIQGSTDAGYTIPTSDLGHTLTCQVVATIGNNLASGNATSGGVTVTSNPPPPPGAPVNTAPPTLSPNAASGFAPGHVETCSPGVWTNDPTSYAYQWLLDGQPIAGETNSTHKTTAGDYGHRLVCRVTASNGGGSASASSAALIQAPYPLELGSVTGWHRGTVRDPDHNEPVPVVDAGSSLTCEPGTWAGATSFTYEWQVIVQVLTVTGGARRKRSVGTQEVREHYEGNANFTVGDFPTVPINSEENVQRTTRIECTVEGHGPGGTSLAFAWPEYLVWPYVAVEPTRPAPKIRCSTPRRACGPTISTGAVFGQTNLCVTGEWAHYPTKYQFEWFAKQYRRSPDSTAKLVGRKPTLRIGAEEEQKYLYCRVTASNSAGSATALSNGYVVPQLGLWAVAPSHVRILAPTEPPVDRVDPATTPTDPIVGDRSGKFSFLCVPAKFNRPVTRIDYFWSMKAVGPGGSTSDVGFSDKNTGFVYSGGVGGLILAVDASGSPIHYRSTGGTVHISAGTLLIPGGLVEISCVTTATISNSNPAATLAAESQSKWVYVDLGVPPASP